MTTKNNTDPAETDGCLGGGILLTICSDVEYFEGRRYLRMTMMEFISHNLVTAGIYLPVNSKEPLAPVSDRNALPISIQTWERELKTIDTLLDIIGASNFTVLYTDDLYDYLIAELQRHPHIFRGYVRHPNESDRKDLPPACGTLCDARVVGPEMLKEQLYEDALQLCRLPDELALRSMAQRY